MSNCPPAKKSKKTSKKTQGLTDAGIHRLLKSCGVDRVSENAVNAARDATLNAVNELGASLGRSLKMCKAKTVSVEMLKAACEGCSCKKHLNDKAFVNPGTRKNERSDISKAAAVALIKRATGKGTRMSGEAADMAHVILENYVANLGHAASKLTKAGKRSTISGDDVKGAL